MFHQYAAPADPKLHAASLAEVRRGRILMGVGAAIEVLSMLASLNSMGMLGREVVPAAIGPLLVPVGLAFWTMGMKQQMTAGVEAKIADEGITGILARCGAQCIIAPRPL